MSQQGMFPTKPDGSNIRWAKNVWKGQNSLSPGQYQSETPTLRERTLNTAQRGAQVAEKGGRAVELTGKGMKNTGRAAEKTGKAVQATGKAAEKTGKALDTAGKPAAKAGTTGLKSGAALTKTGIGAPVGIPLAVGGAGLAGAGYTAQGVGKTSQAAGKGAQVAGKGMERAGQGLKKGGEATEKAGGQAKKAAKDVEGQLGKAKSAAAKAAQGPSGRARLYDKVDPVARTAKGVDNVTGVPAASGALRTGEFLSRTAGKISGGLGGIALGPASIMTGGPAAGAKVGAEVGQWTFRIGATAMFLFAVGSLLTLGVLFGGGDSSIVLPQASATEETEYEMPQDWLATYREVAYSKTVPWPILAAIGEVTSQHGTVNPYTMEDMDGRFPTPSPGPIVPLDDEGGLGGYGPFLLSQDVINEELGGDVTAAQDAGMALEALVNALDRHVTRIWFGEQCEMALEREGYTTGQLDELAVDGELPEECLEGELAESAEELDGESVQDEPSVVEDENLASVAIDPEDIMLRYAAFDRRAFGGIPAWQGENDEYADAMWEEHIMLWYEVLLSSEIIVPAGNEQCFADRSAMTIPQLISLEMRCQALTLDEVYVYRLIPEARLHRESLEEYTGEQAISMLTSEAVEVAWLYSGWGTDVPCEADSTVGGAFPVELADGEEDGAQPFAPVQDRCDNAANVAEAVSQLLERASQPASERPGGDREAVMYEWGFLPEAHGGTSGNTFLEDGLPEEGDWESSSDLEVCEASLRDFFAVSFTQSRVFDDAWESIRPYSAPDRIVAAFDTMEDVPGWEDVQSDCEPLYERDEDRNRFLPDNGWSLRFMQSYDEFDADGTLRQQLDNAAVLFIEYHEVQQRIAVVDPEWGVTAAVSRFANPPIRNVAPNWTPNGSMHLANDIMRASLGYIGEDASQFFGFGGGDAGGLIAAGVPGDAANIYMQVFQRTQEHAPGCEIRLELIAAIGKIESNHGSIRGGTIDPATGDVRTPEGKGISGPPLDGSGHGGNRTTYWDSNHGEWDYDSTYDRAVGPMQFIPSTWWGYTANTGSQAAATQRNLSADVNSFSGGRGRDFSGNGLADPHNYYDAVGSAIVMLCDNGDNITNRADEERAILSYNNSQTYLADVLAEADRVAQVMAQSSFTVGGFGGGVPGDLMATIDWAASTMPGTPYSQCWGDFPVCGPGNRFGYVRGTNDPHFDCSGLVVRVYAEYGVRIPVHDTNSMVTQLDSSGTALSQTLVTRRAGNGPPINESILLPGDALIYRGHMGMYIGNGQVLESQSVARGTNITSFSGANWASRATHVFRPSMLPRDNDIPQYWPT